MLKIKDNVDLKELEQFGFKPRYDMDTGEIFRYICKGEIGLSNQKTVELMSVIKDISRQGKNDYVKYNVILEEKCDKSIDLLYDLIQYGLIERE